MMSYLTHPVFLLTVGGALGTNARYWFGRWVAVHHWTEHFPLATFLINIFGSVLLGLFVVPFRDRMPSWYIFLGVGLCGGYTTFSTFALETVELVSKHHQPGLALLNIGASVVVSCLLVWGAMSGMEKFYPPTGAVPVMAVEGPEAQTAPGTPPRGSASDKPASPP